MQNLELSPVSLLSIFDTTKAERKTFINTLLESLDSGNVNPLDLHVYVKCTEELIKAITGNEEYKSHVMKESSKHGKSFDYRNCKVAERETGVKYNWESCEDPELNRLQLEFDKAQHALLNRQSFLKHLPSIGVEVLIEGGEIIRVFPPIKTSTTSLVITIK